MSDAPCDVFILPLNAPYLPTNLEYIPLQPGSLHDAGLTYHDLKMHISLTMERIHQYPL